MDGKAAKGCFPRGHGFKAAPVVETARAVDGKAAEVTHGVGCLDDALVKIVPCWKASDRK